MWGVAVSLWGVSPLWATPGQVDLLIYAPATSIDGGLRYHLNDILQVEGRVGLTDTSSQGRRVVYKGVLWYDNAGILIRNQIPNETDSKLVGLSLIYRFEKAITSKILVGVVPHVITVYPHHANQVLDEWEVYVSLKLGDLKSLVPFL